MAVIWQEVKGGQHDGEWRAKLRKPHGFRRYVYAYEGGAETSTGYVRPCQDLQSAKAYLERTENLVTDSD